MKIAILGQEGYIGTALTKQLNDAGYDVVGLDNMLRQENVIESGSNTVTDKRLMFSEDIDITNYEKLEDFLSRHKPDVIVHLAEQPSAPFSMSSQKRSDQTLSNNIRGTMNVLWAMKKVCPDAHLIKLGTEGEYPDWIWNDKHIPEGHLMNIDNWEIPTPRSFGSIYHSTKFYESHLIGYFCKVWGLTATDVNQGIVYSHRNETRLDVDQFFGTVIHRFVAQAVLGEPLTIYGTGGQTRGFICLQNSIEAIQLLAENPPKKAEFRVIHQTTEEHSVKEIAEKIQKLTNCEISYIDNPRAEMSENTFTFDTTTLDNLGLKKITLDEELPHLIKVMTENKESIVKEALQPTVKWK